jgi:hypothetical protein
LEDVLLYSFERRGIARDEQEARAKLRQPHGDGAADAARCAGDEGGLAGEGRCREDILLRSAA